MAVAFDPADPASWPALPQPFLVHDFGGAQDYSTIVVGGVPPWSPADRPPLGGPR